MQRWWSSLCLTALTMAGWWPHGARLGQNQLIYVVADSRTAGGGHEPPSGWEQRFTAWIKVKYHDPLRGLGMAGASAEPPPREPAAEEAGGWFTGITSWASPVINFFGWVFFGHHWGGVKTVGTRVFFGICGLLIVCAGVHYLACALGPVFGIISGAIHLLCGDSAGWPLGAADARSAPAAEKQRRNFSSTALQLHGILTQALCGP